METLDKFYSRYVHRGHGILRLFSGMVVGMAVLIAIIALWAALEGTPEGHKSMVSHAH